MLTVYVDGACYGNPGPMGIGIVAYKHDKIIAEMSEFLGKGTNNIAEYTAAIKALELAHRLEEKEVTLRSDSQLFIKQLRGEYKVKAPHLKELNRQVLKLIMNMKVHFEHIDREKNTRADFLAKSAIDREEK
jgi:ribonuclease HI